MGFARGEDSENPNFSQFPVGPVNIGVFGAPPPRSMKIYSRPIGRSLHQGRAAGKNDDLSPQMAIF